MATDPILLELLNHKVAAAAEEMYLALHRTSRSIFVREASDFATAILDTDGSLFAHPPSATFNFLIDTNYADAIRAVPDVEPGDVIFTNDPYTSVGMSTHLPDLHMIMPYFHEGRVIAYGWCFVHCTDIGGAVPSSIAPSLTEVFQEGLRIPPLKCIRAGEWNQDFLALFMANTRAPEMNWGDMKAMRGSMEVGARRVGDIIAQYGVDAFLTGARDLQDYSAEKARAVQRRIPDGTYEFWDYMDDDFFSPYPIRVRVKLTVDDGKLHIDLAGTDPTVKSSYNVPTMGLRMYWITFRLNTFLTTYDHSMPMNMGMYRHITVNSPPGTIMHAEFPDAIGIRAAPARRVADSISGAIQRADPDLLPVPSSGISANFALAEFRDQSGQRTVQVVQPTRGGMGAMKGQDGVDARDNSMNNMRNHPIESVELEMGVILREYDVWPDSGGPGQWRGGVGQRVGCEILRDGGLILARGMERLRFPTYGLAGGKSGTTMRVVLNEGRTDERELPKIDVLPVNRGDVITFMLPGGGGYGDPFMRDPDVVLRDVTLGFVSKAGVAEDYGVILADGGVDKEATARRRRERPSGPGNTPFDFGPDREAWEAVFDDDTMTELNRRLLALPRSVRTEARQRIFEAALPGLPMAGSGGMLDLFADTAAVRARLRAAMDRNLPGG